MLQQIIKKLTELISRQCSRKSKRKVIFLKCFKLCLVNNDIELRVKLLKSKHNYKGSNVDQGEQIEEPDISMKEKLLIRDKYFNAKFMLKIWNMMKKTEYIVEKPKI